MVSARAVGAAGDTDDPRIWTQNLPSVGAGAVFVPQTISPEAHELATAQRLAAVGLAVKFREIDTTKGVKNPDIEISGIVWEMKSPLGSGKNTVSRQLARSARQSHRLVYDNTRRPLDDTNVILELRRRLAVSSMRDEILFIAKNGDVTLVSRTGILD